MRTDAAGSHPRTHRHERTNVVMIVLDSPIVHGDERQRARVVGEDCFVVDECEDTFTLRKDGDRPGTGLASPDLKSPFLSDR